MRIDVHAHYFPTAYVERMRSLGRTDLHPGMGQSSDLSSRIATMDAAGVELQILSAVGLDCQMHDRDAAVDAARFINDTYREVIQESGGRFGAFGWLPLPYAEEALAEAARCLDELDFHGIAMSCSFQGRSLDDAEFEPLWAELNRRAAVVYVHPVGAHSCGHPGMDRYGLHTAYGSFVQPSLAATRLVYSGVTHRYPDIRFTFAVCGGALPYLWPRVERNLRRAFDQSATAAVGAGFFSWIKELPLEADDPMAPFRRFFYDTSVQDLPFAFMHARHTYGVDRLVLGSDEIFASLAEIVEQIEQTEYLSAEEKVAILDRNAQALLRLAA